jgi:hypothetical protein
MASMKSKITVTCLLLACAGAPALAELCEPCRDCSYTKDIGTCVECGGMTPSGAFRLCMGCSDKLRQCEHCRAPLPDKKGKDDLQREGAHRSGRWTYEYSITNEGTRSQGSHGVLLVDGAAVPEPERINDYYQTPWGPLYWVGRPAVLFGAHGWMPKPLAREPIGRQLQEPPAAPAPTAS